MSTIETSILTPEQITVHNNTAVTDSILFISEVVPQIKQDMQKLLAGVVDKEALLAKLFGAGIDQQRLIEVIEELERLTTESEEAQQKISSSDKKNEIHHQFLLKKAVLLDELSQVVHGFSHFRNSYGDDYAINFLKVVRDLKETSNTEVEKVVVERIRRFTAEDLHTITEYWICERPECFMNLLHKYPGVLSAIHIFAQGKKQQINSLFDAMDEVCGIERPISVSVEYVARHIGAMDEQASTILCDFLQARSNVATSVFAMLDVLAKQNKLTQYLDADKTIVLSDDKVAEEQQARVKLHSEENFSKVAALYASFAKEKLEDVELEIKKNVTKNKAVLYQEKAKLQLKLAILKGEDNVVLAQIADGRDVNCEVSSLTGFNPSELTSQQRLHMAECQDELKTYLHFAVEYSNIEAIIRLIENGANIFAQDSQKTTPLMLAFDKEDSKVILNAVLDGLEKRFVAKTNHNAQEHINFLREDINNGVVNKNNVDAKFSVLMTALTANPTKRTPLRSFFSGSNRIASAPAAISLKKDEPLKRGSQSESDLGRLNRGAIDNTKEIQSAKDSNPPAVISLKKDESLKRGSQSESDLTRFSTAAFAENTKETQDATDSEKIRRNSSLSDLMPSRKMAKASVEKAPEEIRLELVKLIDERVKSLGSITTKSSTVKVRKINELNRLRAILEGADTYPVVFILTENNKKKIDSQDYKVSEVEDSPLPPSEMKKTGDVIGRLNLASKLLNRPENRELLAQHRNKRVHKAMTKIRETFIHAIENLLGKKVEENWRESLSKTALFIETFNKLWPGPTVKHQPSAETKIVAKMPKADSHTLVTASGSLGVFRAAAKKVEGANPVLSKLVQSVQGIKPSRSTR